MGTNFESPRIVKQDQWYAERKAFLLKEKELNHALDALREERRQLPWVKVEKSYLFDGPSGKLSLSDLFGDNSQLAVYHFMLAPGSKHVCKGCSFLSDHTDAAMKHFPQADLAFTAISRAPLAEILKVKQALGWKFPWVSSFGSEFNYDFGVSFTKEQLANGKALYNFGTITIDDTEEMFGISIFAKKDGEIYHTYSTYSRGGEMVMGAFMWEDLIPKGRGEMDDGKSRVTEDGLSDSLNSSKSCCS